jgi:hypothetical protein
VIKASPGKHGLEVVTIAAANSAGAAAGRRRVTCRIEGHAV